MFYLCGRRPTVATEREDDVHGEEGEPADNEGHHNHGHRPGSLLFTGTPAISLPRSRLSRLRLKYLKKRPDLIWPLTGPTKLIGKLLDLKIKLLCWEPIISKETITKSTKSTNLLSSYCINIFSSFIYLYNDVYKYINVQYRVSLKKGVLVFFRFDLKQ